MKKKINTIPAVFWSGLAIIGFYFFTHLFRLTKLPVFADESIYIRWSQLIIDDWKQYLFFPLNDGKTPLQMWFTVPFLTFFEDPLFASRLVSVLAGLGQVGTMGLLLRQFGARPKTIVLGMIFTTILPFWFFHHRIALLDGLLTFWVSLAFLFSVKAIDQMKNVASNKVSLFDISHFVKIGQLAWIWLLAAGLALGLALITKVPAILFFPSLGWLIFKPQKVSFIYRIHMLGWLLGSMVLGLTLFMGLKIHPAFGQLFSRGSDFLYPWQEVLLNGKWVITLSNIPNYFSYFIHYLTLPIMILAINGLFAKQYQRIIHLLWLAALTFMGPIMFLGLVVYPRYLFPASIFLTLAATLAIEDFYRARIESQATLIPRAIFSLILVTFLAQSLTSSAQFMGTQFFNPDQTPFVPADKIQYLHEWSSGHGIVETVSLIRQLATNHTVAVATEGYFGTLPDAILMYLHTTDVSNIYVEGIGYPVKKVPEKFKTRAASFDQILLVVNSHRQELDPPPVSLLVEYCRPDNMPCLQVWDITDQIQLSLNDSQNLE